jgi:PAS domain S-box-containing protein
MKLVITLRTLTILSIIIGDFLGFGPNVRAEAPGNKTVHFDRAVFDTGISNTGAFIQDRDGFLWLGTNGSGLVRYDAYQTKVYKPGGPDSLPDTYICTLYEDHEGLIWIGTVGSGLVKYDKETDTFTQYRHDPADPTTIGGNEWLMWSAASIMEDRDGILWVGNASGLNALDKRTGVFTRYQNDPHDPGSLSDNGVRSVFVDQSGVVWVGTDNGLDRFDRQTGAFTRYDPNPGALRGPSGVAVNSIVEGRDGLLWLATLGDGLFSFDRETGTFTRYAHNPHDPNSLSSDKIAQVYEDRAGTLWLVYMGTERMGISTFDKRTGTFTHYTHDPDDPSSLSTDEVACVYEDRAGILWLVNKSGVVDKLDHRKLGFKLYCHNPNDSNSLISDTVVSVHEDRRGLIWIGTVPGLQKYDKHTRTFTRYITDTYYSGIYEDSSGTLWLGSADPRGLHIFDRATGQIVKSYTHDPANPASLALTGQLGMIIEDRHDPNILWIATWDRGVEKFDKQVETFTHYVHDPDNLNSLSNNSIIMLYQDREGYLWIPTRGGGLNRLDPRTNTITRYIHDPGDPTTVGADSVNVAFEDSAGVLWVGTTVGFDKLDRTTGTFTHYTEKMGFPVAAIGTINEDENGNLWLGSLGGGLIKFDPRTEAIRVYKAGDGLQGDVFYPLNGIRDRDGELWFGGPKGLNSFYPREIVDNAYIPPVVVTALKQGGEEMSLGKSPERVQEIVLDWRHNFFEFEYAALNFTRAEKNQYKYMLEGLDKEWFKAGTRRFGRYSGLRGGDYTLHIIGSNNDGVWNEQGVSIKVKVVPLWWETGWFYALVITTVLGIGSLIYRSKSNQIKTIQAAALALQESEERFRLFMHHFPGLAYMKDSATRHLFANQGFMTYLHLAPAEILGKTNQDIFPPEFAERITTDDLRVIESGQSQEVEEHYGGHIWSTYKFAIPQPDRPPLLGGFTLDITERKRAEDSLKRSEAFLDSIIEYSPYSMWISDSQGTLIRLNQAFRELLHLKDEEVIGKYNVLQDNIVKEQGALSLVRQVFERGETVTFTLRYDSSRLEHLRLAETVFVILDVTISPVLDTSGQVTNAIVQHVDITGRKTAEEALKASETRYRRLYETMMDAFASVDLSGRIQEANPAYQAMLGYSLEELCQLTYMDLTSESCRPVEAKIVNEQVLTRGFSDLYEKEYRKKDGTVFPVEIRTFLLRNDTGQPIGMAAVLRDITERKRAEAEREKLIAELEAKNAELERFTYTVSHDLKSPLVTVRGFLGFLEQDAANGDLERLRKDMQRIREATDTMQQLLNDLLELSRIGRMMNPPQELAFAALVQDALERLASPLTERGVQVTVASPLPQVYGDRPRLVEVVQNLVENAIKFCGDQPEPRITIGSKHLRDDVVFFVADNGIGIAPQYHEKIFGLFERLDPTIEGTGVGLALVKRIIEAHGGRIWVESEGQGQGSTFYFTLPPAQGGTP